MIVGHNRRLQKQIDRQVMFQMAATAHVACALSDFKDMKYKPAQNCLLFIPHRDLFHKLFV